MYTKQVFDNEDLRRVIFNFIYPPQIKSGMIMQYLGSTIPKPYLFPFIGKIYEVDQIFTGNMYPLFNTSVIIFAFGIDTSNNLFFPEDDDIIKIIRT